MNRRRRISRQLANLGRDPIVVASHKRSGTHLTIDLLRRQFRECASWKWWLENNNRLYLSLEGLFDPMALSPISEDKAIAVLRRCQRPLVKTHHLLSDLAADGDGSDGTLGRHWIEWLMASCSGIYVYRDGRDALCSLRLLTTRRDPSNWAPMSDFLRQEQDGLSRPRFWADHVERGLREAGVIPQRFEDVVEGPRESIAALGRQLGLKPRYLEPLLPRRVRSVWHARRARLCQIRPQSTAILGRPRGHDLESWRDTWTLADREFFHREAGATLIALGYEVSDAWVYAETDGAASHR